MTKQCSLLLIAVFSLFIWPPAAAAGTVSYTLEAGPYTIVKDRDGFDRISMDGYRMSSSPGNPLLPVRAVNLLVNRITSNYSGTRVSFFVHAPGPDLASRA